MNPIVTIGAYTITVDTAYKATVLALLTTIVVLLTSIRTWLAT